MRKLRASAKSASKRGDACKPVFPDESFDAVTSNYVDHNITGKNKQALLRETLRVLKKGGTFAIHDLMEPALYGDMEKFTVELKAEGYEAVRRIKTTNGMFMKPGEAKLMAKFVPPVTYGIEAHLFCSQN